MTFHRVKRVYAVSIETFFINTFVTIEIYLGGFNLVIFMSFNEKKFKHLDKKLNQCLFLFNSHLKK